MYQPHIFNTFRPVIANSLLDGIDRGFFQEEQEKAHIEDVLGSEALQGRISTLTTEESMDLYCSYFSKVRVSPSLCMTALNNENLISNRSCTPTNFSFAHRLSFLADCATGWRKGKKSQCATQSRNRRKQVFRRRTVQLCHGRRRRFLEQGVPGDDFDQAVDDVMQKCRRQDWRIMLSSPAVFYLGSLTPSPSSVLVHNSRLSLCTRMHYLLPCRCELFLLLYILKPFSQPLRQAF